MTTRDAGCCSCTAPCGPDPAQVGPSGEIGKTSGTLTRRDRWDHHLARWGVRRMEHRVSPGLYRLNDPTPDSPVVVTANYTLSFDAVRSALGGIDAWILVLDTKGINVWCAAGKGTFSTDELVRRIAATGLSSVVRHRTLILPQLAAPGVSAHQVRGLTGFRVEYGPVRAADLPRYLETGEATGEMRRVRFPLRDRLAVAPMEVVHAALPTAVAAVLLYLLVGPLAALAAIAAVGAGTVLFPVLLPYIPTRDYSSRGLLLGGLVALPFVYMLAAAPPVPGPGGIAAALVPLLTIPPVTGYLALNFTGSTPFPSRTGVKREIFTYVPPMAAMAGAGVVLAVILGALRLLGVI